MPVARGMAQYDYALTQEAQHKVCQVNMPLSQCKLQWALLSVTVLLGKTVTTGTSSAEILGAVPVAKGLALYLVLLGKKLITKRLN